MAASEGDIGKLVVVMEARTKTMEKQLAALVEMAKKNAKQISEAYGEAGDQIVQSGQRVTRSIGEQRAAVNNLSFQLQDLAQGLLSGTSPFVLMTQQSGQIVQAFQQAGGGIKGIMATVSGAVSSVLNPMALLTYAFVFLGAEAISYFSTSKEESTEAQKAVENYLDTIKKLEGAFPKDGGVVSFINKLEAYSEAAKASHAAASQLVEKTTELKQLFASGGRAKANLAGMTPEDIEQIAKAIDNIDMGNMEQAAAILLNLSVNNDLPEEIQANVDALLGLSVDVMKTDRAVQALKDSLAAAKVPTNEMVDGLLKFGDALVKMSGMGGAFDQLITGLTSFLGLLRQVAPTMEEINNFRLTLPQVLSDAVDNAMTATPSAAKEYLKGKTIEEGKAVNEKVRARIDMYDDQFATGLAKLFQILPKTAKILSGPRTYDEQVAARRRFLNGTGGPAAPPGLSHHEQRGELDPQAADITGVDAATLAAAVAQIKELETLKGEVYKHDTNHVQLAGEQAKQAKKNAQDQLKALDDEQKAREQAAEKEAEHRKKVQDGINEHITALGEEATLAERINAINTDASLTADQKTVAIKVETELQKELNKAKAEGIDLTATQIAQLRQNATDVALAGIVAVDIKEKEKAAAKAAADALKEAQQAADDFRNATQQAVGGLIKDLIAGKDASEAFSDALGKLADAALNIGLNALFKMGGTGAAGGGGILGGAIIPGILHKGGVAGKDGYGHGRAVSASVFAGAKRYHRGGLVPGEVPAILKPGEVVLPNIGPSTAARGGKQELNIVLQDDSGRMAQIADQQVAMRAGGIVRVSVAQANKTAPAAIAKTQRESAGSEYRL